MSESCSTSLSEQAGECYHFHLGPLAVTIPFSTSHHPVFHPQGKLRHRHSFVTIVIAIISISRISRTEVSIASNHEAEPASRHTTSHRHSPRILVYNPHIYIRADSIVEVRGNHLQNQQRAPQFVWEQRVSVVARTVNFVSGEKQAGQDWSCNRQDELPYGHGIDAHEKPA